MSISPIAVDQGLTLLVFACAVRIAWVDSRRLEIEMETLWAMGALLLIQALLSSSHELTLVRLFSGLAFFALLRFATCRVHGLGRIGAGDPPLIGVAAFMVSPMILAWSFLAAIFILAICAVYSIRRGKKLFKSMFPAAPPILLSAFPFYLTNTSLF